MYQWGVLPFSLPWSSTLYKDVGPERRPTFTSGICLWTRAYTICFMPRIRISMHRVQGTQAIFILS